MKKMSQGGIGSGVTRSGIGRGIGSGTSGLGSQRVMQNNFAAGGANPGPSQQANHNMHYNNNSIDDAHQNSVQAPGATGQTFAEQNKQRIMKQTELKNQKKEAQIDSMTAEAVLNELKDKRLPTYGTAAERKDRLKKQYGIQPKAKQSNSGFGPGTANSMVELGAGQPLPQLQRRVTTTDKIDQIKLNRDARRMKMEEARRLKSEREADNELQGIKVDVDFQHMVKAERAKQASRKIHSLADSMKISVCFKKRPVFQHELADGEIDVVTVSNPKIVIHDCRYEVDGVTKTVRNNNFQFDNAFDEHDTNEELYFFQVRPILDLIFNQGIVTIFAYGQTGSGKTYTMNGIQSIAVKDLFERGIDYWENHGRNFTVTVSMYEIYGGKLYDLLNDHAELKQREDKNNTIQIVGLKEQFVDNDDQILDLIAQGNQMRTTHATKANDTSSRSHAITQIKIQEMGVAQCGKLLLVDLAGSERAQDCQSNNKERQIEGAEINQSLLGLKECVRALDTSKAQGSQGQHVPFRQSKLTMVLRDSFMANEKVKIVMLTCICPGMSSANHTLNSLRYAERLKEKSHQGGQGGSKVTKVSQDSVLDDLRVFLSKHGQRPREDIEAEKKEVDQRLNNVFYQNNNDGIAELAEDDQDLLLNDEQEDEDMLFNNEPEDAIAVMPASKQQQNKRSPPGTQQNNQRKGANLSNISNTMHGQNRTAQNSSSQGMLPENYPPSGSAPSQQSKRGVNHQNQFGKASASSGLPSSKMSPALAKAMGGNNAKNLPKKPVQTSHGIAASSGMRGRPAAQHQDLPMEPPAQQQMMQAMPMPSGGPQPQNSPPEQMMVDEYAAPVPHGREAAEDMDQQSAMEEERMRAEENIYNTHLDAVKEEVQLIQREGEMITTLERAIKNEEEYDMRDYLDNARSIALQKIQMYQQLLHSIDDFQTTFVQR